MTLPSALLRPTTWSRILLAVVLLGSSAALAAPPLAGLAPASTVLAIHIEPQGVTYPALASDLAGLDVAGARSALVAGLTSLQQAFGGSQPRDPRAAAAIGAVLDVLQGTGTRNGLTTRCPALQTVARPDVQEGLVAISATPRTPLPAALALVRFAPGTEADAVRMLDALKTCFGRGTTLEQDGVPLSTLQLDGLALSVARLGDVVAAGTDAELVRTAVRLDHGSSEPSLASSSAGSSPALTGPGVGVTFDAAAVADVIGALPGIGTEAAVRAARGRLLAALRTVPWLALRVQPRADGQLQESWMRVDAAGGDAALARLLRCEACRARPSLLVPANALGVEASNVRLSEWADYLAGIVRDVSAAGGRPLDPLALVRQRTGIDLSTDLFSWLGTVVTSVELPPVAGTPEAVIGAPAQVTIVPVASAAQARDGLDRIGAALETLLKAIPAERSGGVPASALVAVRSERYRDVSYTRIQIGPVADVGIGLVGNWLVVAVPSAALHPIIDTYRGGPMLHDGPLAAALAAAPSGATSVRVDDPAATLRGEAALLRSASQPLAFAMLGALVEAHHSAGASVPTTTPDLASLLTITELPANALDVLAGHLGMRQGWTLWQGDTRIDRTFTPIH